MRCTADTEPSRMHTVASHRFDDVISFLAIGKHIEDWRHTTGILNKGTDESQVIGITVPPRAETSRVMRREFFRLTNNWLFVGTFIQDAGGLTRVCYRLTDRRTAYDLS